MISPHQGIGLALRLVAREIEELRSKKLVIALDGHSSSGKSTMAKDLSKILGIAHVDSGAMYRAVTLYMLTHQIDISNPDKVSKALEHITINIEVVNDHIDTILNGSSVEKEIRSMEVSDYVSDIAAISDVRIFLVDQQRKMAQAEGVIMDGRDIGSVVFPRADVKLFVTATVSVRTQRRYQELLDRGINISKAVVHDNLIKRDHIDSTRKDSPLIQAADAVLIDTSDLDRSGMLAEAIKIIHHSQSL